MGFGYVKRGSEYLDSDMSDGMSDGLLFKSQTRGDRTSVTVRIPESGEYIEMKASSCNIDIDWIELPVN